MRSDLNKVICEHERRGSRDSYRRVRRKKAFLLTEDSPARESMTARYGYNTKDFGEHLNPLYGQVRKAVGRRWDAFYGELCRTFDRRSRINEHILQHLFDRFEKDCYLRDSEIYVGPTRFRYGGWRLRDQTRIEFYVDPSDGIIKPNPWFGYVEPVEPGPATEVRIDRDHVVRKIGDLWFVFTMAEVPPARWVEDSHGRRRMLGTPVRDIFEGTLKVDSRVRYTRFGRLVDLEPLRYHAEKRSASKADLKAAGLRH